VYFLSKKGPVEHTFFTNSEIVDIAVTWTHDTYGKSFYTVYFSHKYFTEKPVVQVCISPSEFITVSENMQQISECLTRTETWLEMIHIKISHLQVKTVI
jgi:hypothetical protein